MKALRLITLLGLLISLASTPVSALSRVKDIAVVKGARPNQLVGYGLVIGLNGDGDKNPAYTLQAIANSLQHLNVTLPATALSSKNIAAVMITTEIPAFMKEGSRIDVTVASIGDAKSLQGGVLLQTPLVGADGEVYAVAQGPLSTGGLSAGNESTTVQKNHPTVAQIVGGALVEKEIPADIAPNNIVDLLLREPDFTSSARLARAVNELFPNAAIALDSTTVRVIRAEDWEGTSVDFLERLEAVEVQPDIPARIIINERTGTIVATARTQIAACAVSHGNITITIANSFDVSQPGPLAQGGQTAVTPRSDASIEEQKTRLMVLPEMPTVDKVAATLNQLGVTPRDMMAIFQAMKQAGALHAELILR